MKNILLLVQLMAEYVSDKIERIRQGKPKATFLSLSVDTFTNESWVDGIVRQGRLNQYLYYYNQNA